MLVQVHYAIFQLYDWLATIYCVFQYRRGNLVQCILYVARVRLLVQKHTYVLDVTFGVDSLDHFLSQARNYPILVIVYVLASVFAATATQRSGSPLADYIAAQ